MDEALLHAYRDTDYLVCVEVAEWACIRIDETLPEALQRKVGARSWGFVTACNPLSKACSSADNLAAQRELFAALQAMPGNLILPAIGIGAGGWHEPSLFVIGPDQPTLDTLARRHRQNAYVYAQGSEPARLRLLSP